MPSGGPCLRRLRAAGDGLPRPFLARPRGRHDGHHVRPAGRHCGGAKMLLSNVLTRLGYGSENATWRNCFLTGAQELHHGPEAAGVSSAGMAAALTVTQLFDSLAIQLDGKRAWASTASIRWHFTDSGETYRMELSNGVLIHHPTTRTEPADLVITLTRAQLLAMLGGGGTDGVDF